MEQRFREKNDRDFVRETYPDAVCNPFPEDEGWYMVDSGTGVLLGDGCTEEDAWFAARQEVEVRQKS